MYGVVEKEKESDSLETKRERDNEETNVDRNERPSVTLGLRQDHQGRGAATK
jgi:hypothetical protein